MRLLEQHYGRLFGQYLTRAEFGEIATCVDISAAATEYFLGNAQDYWDIRAHFGSVRAPHPLGWYEHTMPMQLRTETGVHRLLPPGMTPAQMRVGYRWTQVPLEPQQAPLVLKQDPLPALVAATIGESVRGDLATRQQALRQWQQRRVVVPTLVLCEVVMFGPQRELINGLFGLYLDSQGQPLPDLTVAALALPLLGLLGECTQALLFPLFYALSALNADRAYLQAAPTSPGVAQPLPFTELVLRTPHVPATYPN